MIISIIRISILAALKVCSERNFICVSGFWRLIWYNVNLICRYWWLIVLPYRLIPILPCVCVHACVCASACLNKHSTLLHWLTGSLVHCLVLHGRCTVPYQKVNTAFCPSEKKSIDFYFAAPKVSVKNKLGGSYHLRSTGLPLGLFIEGKMHTNEVENTAGWLTLTLHVQIQQCFNFEVFKVRSVGTFQILLFIFSIFLVVWDIIL